MPSYARSQADVFANYALVPPAVTDPLRAHISGPHAALHRYSVASEKTTINLGEYDSLIDTEYDWPGKATDSLVDLDYAALNIDDALLLFFTDLVGAGSVIAPVSGYTNRIRSSTVAFKDNGDFDRDTDLLRDVQVNDTVYVRGSDGGDSFELWTYVMGFKGEVIAADIDASSAAVTNKANQSASTSIDKLAGADNCITLTADGAAYDGLADGDIDETYTIEVTSGSIDGDLTVARLRITSASGNDDVASKAPSGAGGFTAIGTRGLLVEFDIASDESCSSIADGDEVSAIDLIPGQKWRVHVKQAFTAPTSASSGTYVGEWDTSYIVEVTTGGVFADEPKITVTTTTGVDVSGPTTVTASGTAVAVGTQGVLITFTGAALCKGDKYYIPVTAEAEGSMQTLILAHHLPDEIQDAADLDLKLYIKKNISVPKNRTGEAPLTNWSAAAAAFTVNDSITAFDSSWLDSNDDPVALPVKGGTLYLTYREWLTTFTGSIGSLDDPDDVAATLGTVHPDNPLAYGVHKALTNSNGTVVKFSAVADPDDTDSWQVVLDLVSGRDLLYNLVPLTNDAAVLALYADHIADQSTDEKSLWRGAFFNLLGRSTVAKVDATTSSDDAVVLATLADNPDASGTQYTLLQVTSDNIEMATLGIRAGDIVRYLFTTDGFGTEEYTEFVVDEVLNETTLLLASGHSVAIVEPQKVEVWRRNTSAEIAEDVAERAEAYASNRICVVWPDTIGADGLTVSGYFLCAALAGMRSGVAPHQSLTNVEISGFDDVTRTVDLFSVTSLDLMANSGVWIVTEDSSGVVFTRRACTTDTTDLNHFEEVIRENTDSIVYFLLGNIKNFIGSSNITDKTIAALRIQLDASMEYLKSHSVTDLLGAQLADGSVTDIRQHAILKDHVVVTLSLTLPYAMNAIVVTVVL